MRKTQYYQLSLWDGEDRILRQDFNSDNSKLDAALHEADTRLAASVEKARSDLSAAVEKARSDLTASINSAKSSLSSTISANKSSADSQLGDIRDVMTERVVLLNTRFTASGSDKAVSVNGPALGRCLFYILDITPESGAGGADCLAVDSAKSGKIWTGYSGSAVTGMGIAYLRPGVRNRFVGFPMGDAESPVSIISLGGGGEPQQGYADQDYSTLWTLYLKGSLYGTWRVKIVGVRGTD